LNKDIEKKERLKNEFRLKFQAIFDQIVRELPITRNSNLCSDKLHEAFFWLNKSIQNLKGPYEL
jgi:hypothetical protein